ncbi:MAG: hypothetical protein IKL53_11330 [Lachnospiraceae bacterium]|nr:hypothetical protein [Lachnospiraceae bacterium]
MGEALMFRAGAGGNGSSGGNYELVTHVIETNQTFVMPEGVKDNQVYVRIFGGGGGGSKFVNSQNNYKAAGGGGGWMNNGYVNLGTGSRIDIIIGLGGSINNSGGTTTFGTYLSAAGGGGGYGSIGGSGGAGGGSWYNNGGIGYQFGGGGGGEFGFGGTGGQWGGAGGSSSSLYGGAPAQNGINTIISINESDIINSDAIGYGRGGAWISKTYTGAGGGGYGANGGDVHVTSEYCYCGAGGGGYGAAGCGGNVYQNNDSGKKYHYAGGGGAYGHGGSSKNGSIGNGYRGGGGAGNSNGGNGICLIWYYKKSV